MPKTKTKKRTDKPAPTQVVASKPPTTNGKAPRLSRLQRALALMATIPDPPGSEEKWAAVERGIAEARHPGRKP
jgi:hypothetical protein